VKGEKLVLSKTPIWERQEGEAAMRFMWFSRYLEARLNGGSMTEVCRKYDKKAGYAKVLRNWASQDRWVERVEACRDYLERERQKQRLKDIEEMGERQARNGVLLQQIGIQFFKEKQINEKGLDVSPETAMRFIEVGSKIERTARGVPSEIRAEAELPEDVRKRMEAIYAETIAEEGASAPEIILKREGGG
jgi:hypothetical protein